MMMKRQTVLMFAEAKTLVGADRVELDAPEGATAGEVLRVLGEQYPVLGPLLQRSRLAVDYAFVSPDHSLRGDEQLALIPPVSGG